MKCFVSVLSLLGVAAAAPQFIADTPEVQQAKIAFAQEFNKAARGAAIALQESGIVADPNDPNFSPAAVPYEHVEIPAEPYVHIEPPYVYTEGEDEPVVAAAPVQAPVAPVQAPVQFAQPAFNVPAQNAAFNLAAFQQYNGIFAPQQFVPQQFAPAQQFAFVPQQRVAGGCYNNKGEGVQCRF